MTEYLWCVWIFVVSEYLWCLKIFYHFQIHCPAQSNIGHRWWVSRQPHHQLPEKGPLSQSGDSANLADVVIVCRLLEQRRGKIVTRLRHVPIAFQTRHDICPHESILLYTRHGRQKQGGWGGHIFCMPLNFEPSMGMTDCRQYQKVVKVHTSLLL